MCGRFTLRKIDDLQSRYGDTSFEPSYNLSPGQKILALTDKFQEIEWGFSPYWAEKPFNLINARWYYHLSLKPIHEKIHL